MYARFQEIGPIQSCPVPEIFYNEFPLSAKITSDNVFDFPINALSASGDLNATLILLQLQ